MPNEKKTVIITGCTRGLGLAMVKEFDKLGWQIAGCGRTSSAISNLKETTADNNYFAEVDLLDFEQTKNFVKNAIAKVGAPDVLLNNAGLINKNAPIWQVPEDEFSRVIDINVKAVFYIMHEVIPHMLKKKSGLIVNFSSGWGRSASAEVAPYCCSKWAIEGLSKAVAQELPSGFACVPLNPGIIDTEMLRSCFSEGAESYHKPEEWAKSAVPYIIDLLKKTAKVNGQSLSTP